MNTITIRPKFFRTLISGIIEILIVGMILLAYQWFAGDSIELDLIVHLFILPFVFHPIGQALGFKKHAEQASITLSYTGIEGPKRKWFGPRGRVFIAYRDIEKVTHINHPRWLFTPKIVAKNRTAICVDKGIPDNDFRLMLRTLENHYVKVSDYVWQVYPDRWPLDWHSSRQNKLQVQE